MVYVTFMYNVHPTLHYNKSRSSGDKNIAIVTYEAEFSVLKREGQCCFCNVLVISVTMSKYFHDSLYVSSHLKARSLKKVRVYSATVKFVTI